MKTSERSLPRAPTRLRPPRPSARSILARPRLWRVIHRIARDLALALLEPLARERVHDLVGLGEPSLTGPAHAAPTTQLHQAIRSLHVAPPSSAAPRREPRGGLQGERHRWTRHAGSAKRSSRGTPA